MEDDDIWRKETVPRVMVIVSSRLQQRDVFSLLLVSPWCYRLLLAQTPLWQTIDLREMNKSGEKLAFALSLPRYSGIRDINLEFAQDIEDKHLVLVASKFSKHLRCLEFLNLNACQKITDTGVGAIANTSPRLKSFSIYWNVRITDGTLRHLVTCCKGIVSLNLSGCKNITDEGLYLIAKNFKALEYINITRCIKLTDTGLREILLNCAILQNLNLYALSSLTDNAYKEISLLKHLRILDICGAQNLTDEGLCRISACQNLVSLNLTWCVLITDTGVIAVAEGCRSLELLSLFGIVGVTDRCLESLSATCSRSLKTLDVNGCVGIKRRDRGELCKLFPNLECFKVHS